jgi:phosphatidylglycerol:prolipoprotein diacylglycerol transferase
MYPELFRIGGFAVSSYGVMMALAFVVGGFTLRWQLKKRGVRADFAWVMVITAVIGGILGAKIHYLIIHPEDWPGEAFSGRGLVWFGGMFGALFAAAVVSLIPRVQRSYQVRLMAIADSSAYAMAAGYAVGRMGCFLVGDDYGKVTNLPWGMAFPKGSPPVDVPVHPTQLYEILGSLVIFALLWWVIQRYIKREGVIFFIYLILAGIERFLVEIVRTNPAVALGFTQQQWISIALWVLGIAGIWWFATHGRPLTLLSVAKGKGGAAAAKAGGAREKATAEPAVRSGKPAAARAKTAAKPVSRAGKPSGSTPKSGGGAKPTG